MSATMKTPARNTVNGSAEAPGLERKLGDEPSEDDEDGARKLDRERPAPRRFSDRSDHHRGELLRRYLNAELAGHPTALAALHNAANKLTPGMTRSIVGNTLQ